jgi:hypothetical protein
MPTGRPRPSRSPSNPPPRDPRPGGGDPGLPVLIALGIAIYLLTLLFGIAVVGDTAGRSAIMAAVILGIALTGYLVSGRNTPPKGPPRL